MCSLWFTVLLLQKGKNAEKGSMFRSFKVLWKKAESKPEMQKVEEDTLYI